MSIQLDPELKNRLVEAAEKIVQKIDQYNQASQLRNMIQICQTESELPVLKNFIRYQAARSETAAFWREIHIPVIKVLREIAEDSPQDAEKRRTAMQTFFGYLMRSYVYETKFGKKQRDQARGGRRQ